MVSDNPFENEPENSGGKMVFGTYRMVTNRIDFETGNAGYSDPRYTDKNGQPRHFKAKVLNPKSKNVHVIQDLTCTAKDGHTFVQFRDFMYWAKDVCHQAAMPSHKEHFGPKLEGIYGKTAEVQVELIELDDKGYNRQCFKIVKVFKNIAERESARDSYFSKFGNGESSNGNSATNPNVPDGYTAESWSNTKNLIKQYAAMPEAPKKKPTLVAWIIEQVVELKGSTQEEMNEIVSKVLGV